MRAAERRRGRALDPDVDEVAGCGVTEEVHGCVSTCAAAEEGGIGAARAFDQHLLHATDALRVSASRQVNQNGAWTDAPVTAATVQKLEDIILTRARDLRRASVRG